MRRLAGCRTSTDPPCGALSCYKAGLLDLCTPAQARPPPVFCFFEFSLLQHFAIPHIVARLSIRVHSLQFAKWFLDWAMGQPCPDVGVAGLETRWGVIAAFSNHKASL